MVRRLSDPDGMGATPTHQADVHTIDTDIWGPKDGHPGEIPLPVPFQEPKRIARGCQEGMLNVEGGTIHKGSCQKKRQDGSTGSTAPVSTPVMRGLWSCTTSHMSEGDLYPAEHPFICTLKDSDNPEETPYAATTTGFPLYKGSYHISHNTVLLGFQRNDGDHFISFPIKEPDSNIKQVKYVQVILHPNPIVVGLHDNSDKVYTQPLYTMPIFHFDGKPVYKAQELEVLKMEAEGKDQMDHMIHRLHNPSLTAEVHRFCMMSQELGHLKEAIAEGEDRWGEIAAMQCKTIQRLEMADVLVCIQDQDDRLVDDVLQSVGESAQRGHCA